MRLSRMEFAGFSIPTYKTLFNIARRFAITSNFCHVYVNFAGLINVISANEIPACVARFTFRAQFVTYAYLAVFSLQLFPFSLRTYRAELRWSKLFSAMRLSNFRV